MLAWLVVHATWRNLWLLTLPAVLPLANLAPWTGWVVFDEFDLLALATLAGCYGRWAWQPRPMLGSGARPMHRWLWVALIACSLLALYRGLEDAGWRFGWYQGYADTLNAWRVFKGPAYALALWPLLHHQMQEDAAAAYRRLAIGMWVGLSVVSLAVLWERAAFPGLWNFVARYRTSALFWEMHVGGAAIDGYLAMAVPFVAWALWRARRPLPWLTAALLALAVGYACLTTFSRGVYLSVLVPLAALGLWLLIGRVGLRARLLLRRGGAIAAALLLVGSVLLLALYAFGDVGLWAALLLSMLALLLWRKRVPGWRHTAVWGLSLLLLLEVAAVFGSGSFMLSRLEGSERDTGGRLSHWHSGIRLLATPAEWVFGLGLGRLPDTYARFVQNGEFSGAAKVVATVDQRNALRLYGPPRQPELGGLFAVTQRVPMQSGARYTAVLDLRVTEPVLFSAGVCEMHLIYERVCQWQQLAVRPGRQSWQRQAFDLEGPSLDPGPWYTPRMGVFIVTVQNAGGVIELDDLVLRADAGPNLLRNAGFEQGMAHWLPAAQYYYLPWHIDNLYLEWLIERGATGLLVLLLAVGMALWHLLAGPARWQPMAPFLAASLCGALITGLVSSLMDVPRVAFLFFILLGASLSIGPAAQRSEAGIH